MTGALCKYNNNKVYKTYEQLMVNNATVVVISEDDEHGDLKT